MNKQRFILVEKDGREIEFESGDFPVFPYAKMKELAREHKFVSYLVEKAE